jgi:ERF superfamily
MPDAPEPCKTLAEALAALQARLPRVAKEHKATVTSQRTGKTHSYDYADLLDVSEALLPVMAKLGLSFTACPTMMDGRFVLNYSLLHTSEPGPGNPVGGQYPLPTSGSPQEIGTAITYARRYALCAVTGLAPGGDDDDGTAAEKAHQSEALAKPRTGTNAQLRAEGRMDRQQKAAHEKLAADTHGGGRAERSRPRGPDPDDPWTQDAPVDHQRAAAMREDAEDRPGSSNPGQWQQLAILYGQISLADREMRLADLTDRTGREIGSAKDLSYAEAEAAIRSLRELAAKEGVAT